VGAGAGFLRELRFLLSIYIPSVTKVTQGEGHDLFLTENVGQLLAILISYQKVIL
jgi:hypothetical protein